MNPFPERPTKKEHPQAYNNKRFTMEFARTKSNPGDSQNAPSATSIANQTSSMTPVVHHPPAIPLHTTRRPQPTTRRQASDKNVQGFENSTSSMNSNYSFSSTVSRSRGGGPSLSPQKRRSLMRRKNKPETSFRFPKEQQQPATNFVPASPRPEQRPQDPKQKPKPAQDESEEGVEVFSDDPSVVVLEDDPSLSPYDNPNDEESNRISDNPETGDYHDSIDPKILVEGREYVSIHDDVYNLFFMGKIYGHAFYYSLYVFALKMTLYTFLAWQVFQSTGDLSTKHSATMLSAQFLMLPIAVAMQDDLTATFYLVANIKYCDGIEEDYPNASRWKFNVATTCRAMDGVYSLIVNFVVLVSASDILSLFLNFAALQFLQTIDNIALDLAADGYLTETLEEDAIAVQRASLPKRSDTNWMRSLDTVLFSGTVAVLIGCWAIVAVWNY